MTTRPGQPPYTGLHPDFDIAACVEPQLAPSRRADRWTAAKQRDFLAAVAEGRTVAAAARAVDMSPQSAYSFRQRANGSASDLGWLAANYLAHRHYADVLTSRALEGQTDTYTRADGTVVTRHRHDNRLALAMLSRLDRLAAAPPEDDRHGEIQAARLVAGDWERYLDLIAADATPARAGLFLAARAMVGEGGEGLADALAPVVTLARADLRRRIGASAPTEVETADLDIARRAEWTADQWARAEAAGLLTVAAPPAPANDAQGSQLHQHSDEPEEEEEKPPVWWDEDDRCWRTSFPPPSDFTGDEEGRYGEEEYARELSVAEEMRWEEREKAELAAVQAELRKVDMPRYAEWFGMPGKLLPHEPAPPADNDNLGLDQTG